MPADSQPKATAAAVVTTLHGETMGTTWTAKIAGVSPGAHSDLRQGIQAALDRVVAQMSTWLPDSDLSRFNAAAAGTRHELPPELCKVLGYALDLARDTGGAYDPTVGPLVRLWGFGPNPPLHHEAPSPSRIAAVRQHTGWQRMAFDAAHCAAQQPGGVSVDLSSVAKGYAVDLVAEHLEASGITAYLLEVGGELLARGAKPDGTPWRIAVQRPYAGDTADAEAVVTLRDMAMATSGDYRHYFIADGRRYSHTIDPRTGYPVQHDLASVTVLHAEAMQADALATALSVLGPQAGLRWAAERNLAIMFVQRTDHGFVTTSTPAFDRLAH